MASSITYPLNRMSKISKHGLNPQSLPYVCKRCLATLTESRKLDIPAHSLNANARSTSEKEQFPESVVISKNFRFQTLPSKERPKACSSPKKRQRTFTKQYPNEVVNTQDDKKEKARHKLIRRVPVSCPVREEASLNIPNKGSMVISSSEVTGVFANVILRKHYAREPKFVVKLDSQAENSQEPPGARPGPKRRPEPAESVARSSEIVEDKDDEKKPLHDEGIRLKKPDGTIGISGNGLSAIHIEQGNVARLSHDLDRVLFNPGVYYLQDPRSRIYNFDPYLEKIMPISEFDFNSIKDYITSSKDETLNSLAKKRGLRYTGSSSSMTGLLSHFHFLLSNWRLINVSMLSKNFPVSTKKFTKWCKAPSSVLLRYKDGSYAIDNDNSLQTDNVLTLLGKSMEKLLTLDPDTYERYRKSNGNPIPHTEREKPEIYNYTSYGNILMRSQLDAYDPRLPGSGLFDLKSRAVVSIRMELENHERGSGYEIRYDQGQWESFEREYHDMVRATLLKYALQVRIGRMDGIFVAYHNVERIFGFQYISLEEMDLALHGVKNTSLGNHEFQLSLKLLNEVLDRVVERFPEQSCKLVFETRESSSYLDIYAVPLDENKLQSSIKNASDQVQEIVKKIALDCTERKPGEEPEHMSEINIGNQTDQVIQSKKKQGMDESGNVTMSTLAAQASIPEATTRSSEEGEENEELIDEDISSDGENDKIDASEIQTEGSSQEENIADQPILHLQLHTANKVNDVYVTRPERLLPQDRWELEYRFDEVKERSKAVKSYNACIKRRTKLFEETNNAERKKSSAYFESIRKLSDRGRDWRREQDVVDEALGQVVYRPNYSSIS